MTESQPASTQAFASSTSWQWSRWMSTFTGASSAICRSIAPSSTGPNSFTVTTDVCRMTGISRSAAACTTALADRWLKILKAPTAYRCAFASRSSSRNVFFFILLISPVCLPFFGLSLFRRLFSRYTLFLKFCSPTYTLFNASGGIMASSLISTSFPTISSVRLVQPLKAPA